MTSSFPNSTEQFVASALLHLASSPRINGTVTKCENDLSESFALSKSISRSTASSTVSSDDVSSDEAHLRMVTYAIDRFERQLNLKVVRKTRSKTLWKSDCRIISKAVASVSGNSTVTTEGGSSYLSGGSSRFVSRSRSCKSRMMTKKRGRKPVMNKKKKPFHLYNSAQLLRRSEAILNVLANNGCATEVRIRELLGDSPDTSKALRMLLKKDKVRRSGAGGRVDPFIYEIVAK